MYYLAIIFLFLLIIIISVFSSFKEGMESQQITSMVNNRGPVPYAKNLILNSITFDENMFISFNVKLTKISTDYRQIFSIVKDNHTVFGVYQCPNSESIRIGVETDKGTKYLSDCEITTELNIDQPIFIYKKKNIYYMEYDKLQNKTVTLPASTNIESGTGYIYTTFDEKPLFHGELRNLFVCTSNEDIEKRQMNAYEHAREFNSTMKLGDKLMLGKRLESNDGSYFLIINTDGYLSINKANYDSNKLDKYINYIDLEETIAESKSIWKSGEPNRKALYLVFHKNGDLALRDNTIEPIWNTQTFSLRSNNVHLTNEGKLVIYNNEGNEIWTN